MMMKLNKLNNLEFHNLKISCLQKNNRLSKSKKISNQEIKFPTFLQTITLVSLIKTNLKIISLMMVKIVKFRN